MDIERLMRDLTVDQLENIQFNLQSEMEGKREELRDMVGRRYRDVLEASTEVRQVRNLAETLASAIGDARNIPNTNDSRPIIRDQQASMQRFIALHRLLPLIGDEDGDAITDAFCLMLSESIHKRLLTEHTTIHIQNAVSGMTNRLTRSRRSLLELLQSELGDLSQSDWAANQLAAISLVSGSNLDDLLDMYLKARKEFISNQVLESSSLLSIVSELKATLIVVEQLFAQGDLARVLQSIGMSGWKPALVESVINDQSLAFGKVLNSELETINKDQRERKFLHILTQRITDKCNCWIDSVCELTFESVSVICDFYDHTKDIIEFVNALSSILRDNWPRICSNSSLYQKLFRNVLIDKYMSLIARDISKLENNLKESLSSVSTTPVPIFEKRSGKFDSLLGIGVSRALFDDVVQFYHGVQCVRDSCTMYEKVGMELNVDIVRERLADYFAESVARLSTWGNSSVNLTTTTLLTQARLSLTLLNCEAATICQILGRDGDRITRTNQSLHKSVEDSLSSFATLCVEECFSDLVLNEITELFNGHLSGLDFATEWEKVELAEVGTIEVPVCMSPAIYTVLSALSHRFNQTSVTHLLSRAVRKRISDKIGKHLATILNSAISRASAVQRSWLQLLFDCRLLNTMFPHEELKSIIPTIESHVDPFDLSLISSYLSTNIRLAAQRIQLIFSSMMVDLLPSRETQLSQSYSQVVDIVPRLEHPMRVSLIPRLDRNPAEEVSKKMQASKLPKNKFLANPSASSRNTSFGSFYDKVSSISGFFGN